MRPIFEGVRDARGVVVDTGLGDSEYHRWKTCSQRGIRPAQPGECRNAAHRIAHDFNKLLGGVRAQAEPAPPDRELGPATHDRGSEIGRRL